MGLYRSVADQETATEEDETKTGYLLRLALQWELQSCHSLNQDVKEQSLSGLNSRLKSETSPISKIMMYHQIYLRIAITQNQRKISSSTILS